MKTEIHIKLTITATVLSGMLVIFTGIISLFTLRDAGFASTCIVTGSGLVGAAKACHTYANAHKGANNG